MTPKNENTQKQKYYTVLIKAIESKIEIAKICINYKGARTIDEKYSIAKIEVELIEDENKLFYYRDALKQYTGMVENDRSKYSQDCLIVNDINNWNMMLELAEKHRNKEYIEKRLTKLENEPTRSLILNDQEAKNNFYNAIMRFVIDRKLK